MWKIGATVAMLAAPMAAQAADPACPFPGQTRMLEVRMFFGLDQDGKQIAAPAWDSFLDGAVVPRFSGFTVTDGDGRWLDPQTHTVIREKSKVLEINAPDTAEMRGAVNELSRLYRERFHQKAVGIVSNETCASFY
jgi:hypothetical protein